MRPCGASEMEVRLSPPGRSPLRGRSIGLTAPTRRFGLAGTRNAAPGGVPPSSRSRQWYRSHRRRVRAHFVDGTAATPRASVATEPKDDRLPRARKIPPLAPRNRRCIRADILRDPAT